ITLKTPYQGATAAGQAYAVFPTGSHNLDLVAALQQLLSNYQGVYDTVGQGWFPSDIVFNADRDTGMGNPSSNEVGLKAGDEWQLRLKGGQASGAAVQESPSDATEDKLMKVGAFGLGTEFLSHQPHRLADIDNLNTPTGFYGVGSETTGDKPNSFGVVQVVAWYTTGTGIAQITQIFWPTFPSPRMYIRNYRDGSGWSPWREVYSQERVVGPVSHSDGTPTGAVIERGSNANGEYVRFADGTQICTRSVSLGTRSSTSESGGLYRSDTFAFGLPAVFAPSTTVGASLGGDLFPNGILHAVSANTSQWSVRMGAPSSFASLNCGDIVLTAVGRWF
ncbi:hypothetical protein HGG73_17795, partial [Rhodobacteraceae bacterium R_SAG3]|nr:hypothetical protein [Rhodobacteraceae bacterium R_SAG3]